MKNCAFGVREVRPPSDAKETNEEKTKELVQQARDEAMVAAQWATSLVEERVGVVAEERSFVRVARPFWGSSGGARRAATVLPPRW